MTLAIGVALLVVGFAIDAAASATPPPPRPQPRHLGPTTAYLRPPKWRTR